MHDLFNLKDEEGVVFDYDDFSSGDKVMVLLANYERLHDVISLIDLKNGEISFEKAGTIPALSIAFMCKEFD